MNVSYRHGILWLAGLLFAIYGQAQKNIRPTDHDTAYYVSFDRSITGRFYFSQKFTTVELESSKQAPRFRYRPNTTFNMGVGATYRFFTLNLAYGFGFLNHDEAEKGKTKYLDLQSHLYGRKWSIDLFGQFYNGFFLYPKGLGSVDPDLYYIRPDIKVTILGIAPFRIMNEKKFSYRAAMLQNEWQKKSAGSLLLGGEPYYGSVNADSAFVPANMSTLYEQQGIHKINFFDIGLGAGYAYTLVIKRHFFLTGSLTGSLDVGWVRETNNTGSKDKANIEPNLLYRGVIGYNSRLWNVNVSWVSNRISARGASSSDRYIMRTSNLRITFARQFRIGPKLKKIVEPIDKVMPEG